jgi:hypothetical protein
MNETLQLMGQFYVWLGVNCKGEDPSSFDTFKWIALVSAFNWMTGESFHLGLVPQFIEYLKERRIMDVLNKKRQGDVSPLIDRHSPVSDGHVYCPSEACEYPVLIEQDGAAYCCGCSAHVGNVEREERVLSILVKEVNGTVTRTNLEQLLQGR